MSQTSNRHKLADKLQLFHRKTITPELNLRALTQKSRSVLFMAKYRNHLQAKPSHLDFFFSAFSFLSM